MLIEFAKAGRIGAGNSIWGPSVIFACGAIVLVGCRRDASATVLWRDRARWMPARRPSTGSLGKPALRGWRDRSPDLILLVVRSRSSDAGAEARRYELRKPRYALTWLVRAA